MNERDGAIDVAYEYDAALFEASTIERLAARFARLLDAVAVARNRLDELGMPEALPRIAHEIMAVQDTERAAVLSPATAAAVVRRRFRSNASPMPRRP